MAEHVEQKLAEHNSTASLPKTRRTLLLERSVQVMEEMHALCREYHSFVEELFPEVPLSASGDAATVSAANLLAPGREKATVSSANGFAAVIDDDAESVIISEVEEDDYDSNGLAPFISHAQAPPTLVPASPRQSNVGKSDIVLTDTISITPIPVELESSDEDRHGVAFADRTIPFMDNADDDDYLADVDHGGAVITMQSFESSASRTVDDVSEEVLKSTHTPALKQSQATSGKRKSPEETREAVIDYLRSCEATYNRIVLYEVRL